MRCESRRYRDHHRHRRRAHSPSGGEVRCACMHDFAATPHRHRPALTGGGEEPLMPPELIREVAGKLATRKDAMVATACHAIRDRESLVNPNVVKVVCDAEGYALYFSRAALPGPREAMARQSGVAIQAYRHIGLSP